MERQRRPGACSWQNPLGDLLTLFPDLPSARKPRTSRPEQIALRSTAPPSITATPVSIASTKDEHEEPEPAPRGELEAP